jgi:hypothetical protein
MSYKPFTKGQKITVEAFEDLPKYRGKITDVGPDYIGILVTDKPNIPETYAEIYEENFSLVTVLGDVQ